MHSYRKHPFPSTRSLPRGFTLIEILVVIGIISVLASIVLVAINPAHQFAQAHEAERVSGTNAILNAISNRIAEKQGYFEEGNCGKLPGARALISNAMGSAGADLRPCLVPTYISELPVDVGNNGYNTCTGDDCNGESYNTGYTVEQDPDTHRVKVCAPGYANVDTGQLDMYCLTR